MQLDKSIKIAAKYGLRFAIPILVLVISTSYLSILGLYLLPQVGTMGWKLLEFFRSIIGFHSIFIILPILLGLVGVIVYTWFFESNRGSQYRNLLLFSEFSFNLITFFTVTLFSVLLSYTFLLNIVEEDLSDETAIFDGVEDVLITETDSIVQQLDDRQVFFSYTTEHFWEKYLLAYGPRDRSDFLLGNMYGDLLPSDLKLPDYFIYGDTFYFVRLSDNSSPEVVRSLGRYLTYDYAREDSDFVADLEDRSNLDVAFVQIENYNIDPQERADAVSGALAEADTNIARYQRFIKEDSQYYDETGDEIWLSFREEHQTSLDQWVQYKKALTSVTKDDAVADIEFDNYSGGYDSEAGIEIIISPEKTAQEYLSAIVFTYTTYLSAARDKLPAFFTYTMAAHYTHEILSDVLDIEVKSSIEDEILLMHDIMSFAGESSYSEIYFTGDPIMLQTMLDERYGEGFYNNTTPLLNSILYQPQDSRQELIQILEKYNLELGDQTYDALTN